MVAHLKVIVFLALYLPFEEFILKWIPVSDFVYQLLRQLPDTLIIATFFALIIHQLRYKGKFYLIGRNIDLALMLFLLWAVVTIIFSASPDSFRQIANVKALVRYIFIVYIILLSNPSYKKIKSLFKWIYIAFTFEVCIGAVQFFGGIPVRNFLAARNIDEGIGGLTKTFTGDRFDNLNEIMGTMGDHISFAYFMLVGLIMSLYYFKPLRFKYMVASVIVFILIYLSNSRAVLIIAVLVWSLRSWGAFRAKNTIIMSLFLISLLPVFLFILDVTSNQAVIGAEKRDFTYIFNEDYIEAALNQRLGTILLIVPAFIADLRTIVGFGPDKFHLAEIMMTEFHQLPYVLLSAIPNTLEDVYWVALLLYYGFIGLFIWVYVIIALYKKLKLFKNMSTQETGNAYAGMAINLFISVLFLAWFNAAFEIRAISFYLWVFVGAAIFMHRKTDGYFYESNKL